MNFMPRPSVKRNRFAIPNSVHLSAEGLVFLATFIEALHKSRRRQAAHEIRRYQHLVEEARAHEERRARRRGYDP
jgi:hypothetical protein